MRLMVKTLSIVSTFNFTTKWLYLSLLIKSGLKAYKLLLARCLCLIRCSKSGMFELVLVQSEWFQSTKGGSFPLVSL
jgi:hypothetical protein